MGLLNVCKRTDDNFMNFKRKKTESINSLFFSSLNCTNYAATAGATRATGKDSPAAKSRGKL